MNKMYNDNKDRHFMCTYCKPNAFMQVCKRKITDFYQRSLKVGLQYYQVLMCSDKHRCLNMRYKLQIY